MLDSNERLVFDGMVTNLRAEDPEFRRQVDELCRPRNRKRLVAASLLWTVAPVTILIAGWSGIVPAVLVAGYGARLMTRRTDPEPQPQWWTAEPFLSSRFRR